MSPSCVLEFIKALGPIAALLFVPWIAMRVYYRQKEYGTTKQRYLEGCLDVIAGHLQATLGTVSHNYARCMGVCKAYRDYGGEFDTAELNKGKQWAKTMRVRLQLISLKNQLKISEIIVNLIDRQI